MDRSGRSNSSNPTRRRGRVRISTRNTLVGNLQSTRARRGRLVIGAPRNPLRATAARNSNIRVAGRRARRLQAAIRRMSTLEILALINNNFTDCEYRLLDCQRQLGRLGRLVFRTYFRTPSNQTMPLSLPPTALHSMPDAYMYSGELSDQLRNIFAENGGEYPVDSLSQPVSHRDAMDDGHDNNVPLVGPQLAAPPISKAANVNPGDDSFRSLITSVQNLNLEDA